MTKQREVNHLGGRPKLPPGEKKEYTYKTTVNTLEHTLIEAKRKLTGMEPAEFTREALKNITIVPRLDKEVLTQLRSLTGMGNNINQLAHEAHLCGYEIAAERDAQLSKEIVHLVHDIRTYIPKSKRQ